ncbi:MAG TPA: hypothetical protein ENJ08_10480 [Gammaproteobacteria bacterium]|nr:hypothetical protein [Gammaproteobacteria bacterium]
MTTPLSLFKESPRWRIAVISAFVITATVILVQPDPQRRSAQATRQSPPPRPAAVSSAAQTPSTPRVSSTGTQKKTPASPSARSIQPGSSSEKARDVSLPATRAITPSGDRADEMSTETPEVTPTEEQNSLIPSG